MMADDRIQWEQLDKVEQGIERLVARARALREPSQARGRELATVLVQEIGPISRFDYNPKVMTFYNGDERDLVVERLSCAVYLFNSSNNQVKQLERFGGTWTGASAAAAAIIASGGGWVGGLGAADIANYFIFDFLWNYQRDKTQAKYSRDRGVSSFALGDYRKKKYLDFARPLVLQKGEGMHFEVMPTCFRNVSSTFQFVVSFIGLGYRREPRRGRT